VRHVTTTAWPPGNKRKAESTTAEANRKMADSSLGTASYRSYQPMLLAHAISPCY
jgi:hypothetical protein